MQLLTRPDADFFYLAARRRSLGQVQARTAVFLRDQCRQSAGLGQGIDERDRKITLVVDLAPVLVGILGAQVAQCLAQHAPDLLGRPQSLAHLVLERLHRVEALEARAVEAPVDDALDAHDYYPVAEGNAWGVTFEGYLSMLEEWRKAKECIANLNLIFQKRNEGWFNYLRFRRDWEIIMKEIQTQGMNDILKGYWV